jgi:hypothetical protein
MKMTPCSMPCLRVRRLPMLSSLALLLMTPPLCAQPLYTPQQKGSGTVQPTGERQAKIKPPKAAGEYAFIQLNELKGKNWSVKARVSLEGVVPANPPKNAVTPLFQLNNNAAEPGKWNYQMALSLDWGQDGKSTPRIALPRGAKQDFPPIQLPQVFHVRVQRKEDRITVALLKESSEPPQSEVSLPATGDTLYMTWGSLGTETKHTTFEWQVSDLEIQQGAAISPGVTPQPAQNGESGTPAQPSPTEDPRVSKAAQQAGGAIALAALALLASLLAIVLTVVTFVLNRGKGAKDSAELPGKIAAIEAQVNSLTGKMATKQDMQSNREQITKDLTERVQQGFATLNDRIKAAEAAIQSSSAAAPSSSGSGLDDRVQSCEAQLQQIAGQIQSHNSDISNLRASLNTLMDKIALVNRTLQQMEQTQRSVPHQVPTQPVAAQPPPVSAGQTQTVPEGPASPTTPAVTIIQTGQSEPHPADNAETVAFPTPVAAPSAPAWVTQWRQLRQSLNAHRASVTVESFGKDLDMMETYFKTLIEKWETLKPPAEDAQMWDEWLFSTLDYHLYHTPRLTSLGEVSPEIRNALERLRSVIEEAQEARRAQLREWELERIEGVPGKDRATAYVLEADPENPPEPTNDPRKDYTFSHIVPGRGGYRFRGRVLRKTHAVFYRYNP